MDSYTIRHGIYFGIVLVGALLLLAAPFTASVCQRPRWVRVGLFMASAVALAWSLIRFAQLFFWQHLSRALYLRLDHCETLLAGVAIGMLSLLAISGELPWCCRCLRLSRNHEDHDS
jgi:hypothetical protein